MEHLVQQFLEKAGSFTPEEIKAVAGHTQVKHYRKGTVLSEQGRVSDTCYFVLEGCLRQYQQIDGEEKNTGFFLEGQAVIQYASYLRQEPATCSVACVEDSLLLTGTRKQEQELHRLYPRLSYLTHVLMVQDYQRTEEYLSLLNGYKPEDRYRMLLEKQPELFQRVPLHQMASFLGISPESFSRIRKRVQTRDRLTS